MKKDDEIVLLDVVEAAQLAHRFVQEVKDANALEANQLVRSAVLHQILIKGEAVKRLSDEFRERHSHLPWNDIAGMRDRIIHGYDTVDFEIVWIAATQEISALLEQLQPMLHENSDEDEA